MTVGYTYSNDNRFAAMHHQALATLLDGHTRQLIQDLPMALGGRYCLDVGAGSGTIATWLARQVGEYGAIVATDIDITRLKDLAGVRAKQHDITLAPPPDYNGFPFDLVLARLVLNHLPGRLQALDNMIAALKPGGWLLTQDFRPTEAQDIVKFAPTEAARLLLQRFWHATLDLLAANGNDRTWSEGVVEELERRGMTDVRVDIHDTGEWIGGSAGCNLLQASLRQTEHKLEANGSLDRAEVHRIANLLDNQDVLLQGHMVHSVSARRPTHG